MTNSPLLPPDMKCVDDPKLYESFLFTELLRSLNLAHIHSLSSESTSVILTSLKEIACAILTWGYPVRIVPVHCRANIILWGSTELAVNLQNINKALPGNLMVYWTNFFFSQLTGTEVTEWHREPLALCCWARGRGFDCPICILGRM